MDLVLSKCQGNDWHLGGQYASCGHTVLSVDLFSSTATKIPEGIVVVGFQDYYMKEMDCDIKFYYSM